MVSKELQDYVVKARAARMDDAKIKEELQNHGWKPGDIDEALAQQGTPAMEGAEAMPQPVSGGNTSGQGKTAAIPAEIKGWNWGAFFLTWIWGIGNHTFIALLALIPFVNIVMAIVLGLKGNEWAWQNKKWDSIQQFKQVQKKWALWGIGVIIVSILFGLFSSFITELTA